MKTLLKVACLGLLAVVGKADVASFFDEGSEGWTAVGDTSVGVEYLPTGGRTGSGLRVKDDATGGVWYWVAAAKFLGNQSSAFGRSLRFDLKQVLSSGPDQFETDDVVIETTGLRLVFDIPSPPTDGTWRTYEVPLIAAAGWKVSSSSGAAATDEQLKSALTNITRLLIRGEFQTGPDTGFLDNVVLGSLSSDVRPTLDIKYLPVISIAGPLGSKYLIEYSEPLTPGSWTSLTTVTLTESPLTYIDRSAEGRLYRSYRATLLP